MKLTLKPRLTCISIIRKPKFYVAMSHATLTCIYCLRLNEASSFRRKKLDMRIN